MSAPSSSTERRTEAARNADGRHRYNLVATTGRDPVGIPAPPRFSLRLMPSFTPASVTQELLFHLARMPGAVHRDALAKAAGTSKDYAGRVLSELVRLGRVERVGRGTYNLAR